MFATMRNLDKRGPLENAIAAAGVAAQVQILQLDVTDSASIDSAAGAILLQGGLEAVVHNAGIAVAGAFEDLPEAELRRVMETNFFGVMALTLGAP